MAKGSVESRLEKLEERAKTIAPEGYVICPPELELIYGSGVRGVEELVSWSEIDEVLTRVYGPEYGPNALVSIYLATIPDEKTRMKTRQWLEIMAEYLTGSSDIFACDWGKVRIQDTEMIRDKLAETELPPKANLMLETLRGVLETAWKRKKMDKESYWQATSFDNVDWSHIPRGRVLTEADKSWIREQHRQDPTFSEDVFKADSRDVTDRDS